MTKTIKELEADLFAAWPAAWVAAEAAAWARAEVSRIEAEIVKLKEQDNA